MTGLTNALPTDVGALQAMILAERAAHANEGIPTVRAALSA